MTRTRLRPTIMALLLLGVVAVLAPLTPATAAPGAERAGRIETAAPGAERAGRIETAAPGAERAGRIDTAAPGAERNNTAAPRQEAFPHVRLADWYGTADAVALTANSGAYLLTRNAGNRAVVLEERSVRVRVITRAGQKAPIQRATPWHRLAAASNGTPVVGQWTRSPGFNGKQFRLCRLGAGSAASGPSSPGVPGKGKVCTAYSGVIVPR